MKISVFCGDRDAIEEEKPIVKKAEKWRFTHRESGVTSR
jgi:hypothetical protein